MKKIAYLGISFFLTGIILTSCFSNDEEELKKQEQIRLDDYLLRNNIVELPYPSGLYVLVKNPGVGNNATSKDFALVNYTYTLIDNTVIDTNDSLTAAKNGKLPSSELRGPVMILIGNNMPGVIEGFSHINEGTKAQFIIPSKLAFGSYAYSNIPSYSTIIYSVELVKIIKDADAYDRANINRWVDSFGLQKADSTEDGVYLKIDSAGIGEVPANAHRVTFEYIGWLADNRYFTSKTKYTSLVHSYGENDLIKGMIPSLEKLRNGAYARIIIPYEKAYGYNGKYNTVGQSVIPPYSSLVYKIHITKIE